MRNCRNKRQIRIMPSFYIMLALAALIMPVQWILAWSFAVFLHELGHYIMICLCQGQVYGVELGMSGAKIKAFIPTSAREFLCAIAGPVGSLLPLLAARWIPRVAICGLLHAAFNLLPITPLDGGRAVNCLVGRYLPHRERLADLIEIGTLCILTVLGLYVSVRFSMGVLPLLLPAALLLKQEKIKIPCNAMKQRVQ